MTNSPAASEASQPSDDNDQDNAVSTSKSPAVKDKACQYCQQKFTSSSLGRHLDQFISKKKPDGIHDVDEIRRMRGGITRRTARNSHKKEQDDSHSVQHSPSPQYTLPSYSELLTKTAAAPPDVRLTLNRMNWQATGVITDPSNLNPPAANVVSPPISTPSAGAGAGTKRNYSTYASDLPTSNAIVSEATRALELSLREVLDAVRTATKKATPTQQPFTFDFNAQTFPYLCLALLPVPPTLFTPTPFATQSTVPLSPPGLEQYQNLRKSVDYYVDQWKWDRLSHVQRTVAPSTLPEEMDNINDSASTYLQDAVQHLDAAYQNFMSFSPESRSSLWTIELLRAFKKEQDKVKEANAKTEKLIQETVQLQQQIDHLSRCQWPREMALWPPEKVVVDGKTRDELTRINLLKGESNGMTDSNQEGSSDDSLRSGLDRWDYDLLVNKWKRHVREDRSRRSGVQSTLQFLPGTVPPMLQESHTSAPSEHSTASTPRISSGLAKSATADYRTSNANQGSDGGGLQKSPQVNGTGSSGGPVGFDSRRRNIQVVSDVEDIFIPRYRGLRADGLKSATP